MNGLHASRRSARGFTLIELMVVVTIIGVLASVAMPEFTRLLYRAKAAERHEVMLRIKKAVADTYVQKGQINGGVQLVGDWQPALPVGQVKRMPNWRAAGWDDIFRSTEEIEGATYYSYRFVADDSVNPPTLSILAWGDLDGDGTLSIKQTNFERVDGLYQLVLEFPVPGQEDFISF